MSRQSALILVMALSVCLLIASWVFRHQLGFETSSEYIQKELGGRYVTEHFQIFYSRSSFTDEEMKWVGREHEFRYDQIARVLHSHLRKPIATYIYPDAGVKQRLIGASGTNIAKPWRGEIHINKESWQQSLKHEMVHVMAGEFGMPIIHAHYNTGLVEGLATAIDGDIGNRTLHEYAAAVKVFRIVKQPERLIRPSGFAMRASTVSYTLMGSFCKYLIDRYGVVRFKELYGGQSVDDVYGRSYDMLVTEWQDFLTGIPVPDSWKKHVEFYFSRPSIFAKECARAVANLNEEGYRNLEARNSVAATGIFSRALTTSWNTESYQGLVRAAYNAMRFDTVVYLVHSQMKDSSGRSGIVNLFLLYGDALWRTGDTLSAKHAYQDILDLDLSERMDEAAATRLVALEDENLRPPFLRYFTSAFNDSMVELCLDSLRRQSHHPILAYLQAKLFVRTSRYANTIDVLDTMRTLFPYPMLNAGREQTLGWALLRMEEFQRARAHFWQSLNYISNRASRERVDDLVERCDWLEENVKSKR